MITDPPKQIAGFAGVTESTGKGFTVTAVRYELVHPCAPIAVSVYVVETVGLAVTVVPVVALNPVPGLQVYPTAFPLAVNVADDPKQNAAGADKTVGSGLTTTTCTAVSEHRLSLPEISVTVYEPGALKTCVGF